MTTPVAEPLLDVSTESASTNFFWRYSVPVQEGTPHQEFDLQTTLRGLLDPAQIAAHIAMIQTALVFVVDQGGVCKQVGNYQAQASTKIAHPRAATQSAPQSEPESADAEPVDLREGEAGYFEAEKLVVSEKDGKTYSKVIGKPPFHKFGVTIWPEVLAAAGKRTDLLPTDPVEKGYDLKGYRAFYAKNEKGSPSKVVRLEKVAG